MAKTVVTEWTRPLLKAFEIDAENALQRVAEQYGVDLSYRGGKFSQNTFETKWEFSVIKDGVTQDREEKLRGFLAGGR